MRAAERVVAAVLAVVALWHVPPAHAFGVRYPDPVAAAAGAGAGVVAALSADVPAWTLEVADCERFGGTGLRESGVRARVAHGRWQVSARAVVLNAGPGSESRLAARAGVSSGWTLLAGVVHDVAAIDGFNAARRTTVELTTGATVAGNVRVRCAVTGFRVAGIDDPGADIDTGVTVVAGDMALTSALVVDRAAGAHARLSMAVRGPGDVIVVGGYDDETTTLSLAVSVAAGGLRAGAVASVHPVLGTSRGAALRWGW